MFTIDGPDPNKVLLDEIHRLRGEFLSTMVDVEERLNLLIMIYFEVPPERRDDFLAWVLGTLRFADKVQIVAKATRANEQGSTMKDIIAWVKRLNDYRNDIAHGGVTLYIDPDQPLSHSIDNWKWASVRSTRSGPKREVLSTEDMQRSLKSAQYLAALLFTVMDEMAKAPGGIIALDIDWRVTFNNSLGERGIPVVSAELHNFFRTTAGTWPNRGELPANRAT